MTTYKLTYFDISGGRGEPIRIAFHAGGIPFEDNRLSGAEFAAMRENTRFRYLPVLEIDGAAITQSNAMWAGWLACIPRTTCRRCTATKSWKSSRTIAIGSARHSAWRATR